MKNKNTTTPDNARNAELKAILERFKKERKDPFDRENIEALGNEVIMENKHWYVIPNQWPYTNAKHHFVIICKRKIQNIVQMSQLEINALQYIQSEIIEKYNITGGAFCMRFGNPKLSGTTCTRLHGHILNPKRSKLVTFPIGIKQKENGK